MIRNPGYIQRLPKSIFWITQRITPITELRILKWKFKGKRGQMVTALHADIFKGFYRYLSEDYFYSKKDYFNIDKPGISYVYIEQKHWLKYLLYLWFIGLVTISVGWISWLFEKWAFRLLKGTKYKWFLDDIPQSRSWRYKAWQGIARWYVTLQHNWNPFRAWRRSWIMAVRLPKIVIQKHKEKLR